MKWILPALVMLGLLGTAATVAADEPTTPAPQLEPLPVANGMVEWGPSNSRINFIGVHEGDEPRPRLGGFAKFAGRAEVGDSGQLREVALDIDTGSLWTEISKLTNHLKSPDFFDVRQHPKATFRSTSIKPAGQPGGYTLQGELTLLGVTKRIEVPATVEIAPEGLTLASDFAFDRREFGMDYGQGDVKNQVTVKIRLGEKTPRPGDASATDTTGR